MTPKIAIKTAVATKNEWIKAVGRRKRSSAQVWIKNGSGEFAVNGKSLVAYFGNTNLSKKAVSPILDLALEKKFDISVKVRGGGGNGQSEAIRHGLSRCLTKYNEDFKKTLRTLGYLTRDPREKERKKFGLKKARKAPQWSKR